MGRAALVAMGNPVLQHQSDCQATHARDDLVKVSGFGKSYRKRTAVEDVSFNVRPGELYGLLGPDGAGKSSLMKAIAGVMTFDEGCVEVFGVPLSSEAAAETIKDRIGFMPQGLGLNLYPELSVEENIDFFARLRLVSKQDLSRRKERLLAMTRLSPFRDRSMKKLSGGMKQKLGLICTLIHDPILLILDEPTTGVDPLSRRDFWNILSALVRERELSVLVTTAYMDEASRFHRLSLMYNGKLMAQGEPEAICAQAPGRVLMFKSPDQAKAIDRLRQFCPQVQASGTSVRVFVDELSSVDAIAYVRNSLGEHSLDDIREVPTELEDAFTALLRCQQGLASDHGTETGQSGEFQGRPEGLDGTLIAIEARGLTKRFGEFTAADTVNFQVREGQIVGLLGANGAGKTTVIKMLTGILSASAGGGSVAGADLSRLGREIKQRIGYMSQQFSLYSDLTVTENIMLYAGVYGLRAREARERCKWVCDMSGLSLDSDERTSNLPVGMRQRLALGCALVHRPRVLFLDEPTSGIDPIGRQRFWDILFQLSREEGVAILLTTHYMSEADHCDQLVLMHSGQVVADASPDTLKREVAAQAGQLLEVDAPDAQHAITTLVNCGFQQPVMFGQHLHVWSTSVDSDIGRIATELELDPRTIRVLELTMDDVFVHRISALEALATERPAV